jgi:L-amino acid N-acyltransferase
MTPSLVANIQLITCTYQQHAGAILDILNEAIATSTALYDYNPRTIESMKLWFDIKNANSFPVLGLVNDQQQLMAFGSFGTFRAFPAFKYSVEHSVYVHKDFRGKGYGRIIMQALIEAASSRNLHALIGAIDANNTASINLHKSLGFMQVGVLSQVGFKFGRWLDLAFYQLLLDTPQYPIDG